MNLIAALPVALRALRINALRSLLAMLGVVIGVGSVIVMISISDGAKAEVERQISSLGSNMLIVRPGSSGFGGRRGGAGTAEPLTDDDGLALLDSVPSVLQVSGEVSTGAPVIAEGVNWTTRIQGVDTAYVDIRDWPVGEGRIFSPSEVRSGAKVAVLGQTVAEELFGDLDAVGQSLRIRNVPFQVIGVLTERGEAGWGGDQDDVVLAPVTTVRARIAGGRVTVRDAVETIYVEVAGGADMTEARAEIEDLLRVRRHIRPGAQDDFNVRDLAEFIRARNAAEAQLGLLLAWTAVISLVVGGIGIMNIMLVSVTERTREIGLRMALGARRGDVRAQFLVESVTLCVAGGALGLAIGLLGAVGFSLTGEFPVSVSPTVIAVALASSMFVGVAFGFYPAHRAAMLDPIEALRHE